MKENWIVYMLRCSDSSLYTGITKDIEKRVREHNSGSKLGAKYTRSRAPVTLVYSEQAKSRSHASKREYEIKQMNRQAKEMLLKGINE